MTDQKFLKYSSIENTYRQAFLNKIVDQGKSGGEWVVAEKIHGANFQLYKDADNYIAGSRTEFIDPSKFYNCTEIVDQYKDSIQAMYEYLKADSLIVYGELFGGSYPHTDVSRNNQAHKIMSGVFYSPNNHFASFDIKVNGSYIDDDTHTELCTLFNIPMVPKLFRGTYLQCLEYSNKFNTKVPEMFGLPEIENNFCEGVVIKPVIPAFMGDSRVIIKNKNEKFAESKNLKEIKPVKEFSFEAVTVLHNLRKHITEERLRSVISKVGKITEKDFGKLLGGLNKDIWEEYNKEELSYLFKRVEETDKEEAKRISKTLNNDCANFIRRHFLNIIDGVF